MTSEKTKLYSLLSKFKDIEKKLEISKNTSRLVKRLLLIPIFYDTINKKFNAEEIENLQAGNASIALTIAAKTNLLTLSKKIISDIEVSLYQKTINHETHENNRIGSLIENIGEVNIPPDKTKSSETQEAIKASEFYNSFFSASSLKQLLEFTTTGRIPPAYKKYLSVCFIDIVGFSTMAEHFPSEKVVSFLNFFFNQVQGTIEKYGGDIDKFIGDALLIIFDSAESAVRCSLEILLKDLDVVNFKLQSMKMTEIKVHCGINTGWIVQGYIGSNKRRETTVIGDGVNIASRIQSISPPNKIYITSTTFVSLGKLKNLFEPLGRKKLRGRVQEVMVYEYIKKVPSFHTVILYEYDIDISDSIERQMQGIGVKNLIKCSAYEHFESTVSPGKNKILVIGPSISLDELINVYHMVNQKCEHRLPIIPIIRKSLDANAYSILEKIELHTIVPLYIEGSMEKVSGVLATENVKEIPRRKIEPKPTVVPNEIENNKTTEILENKPFKTTISANPNEIIININSILSMLEKENLQKDIEKLWEYSSHKKNFTFIFKILITEIEKLDELFFDNIFSILDFISNPEEINIKVDFVEKQPPTNWKIIKSSFKYQFI